MSAPARGRGESPHEPELRFDSLDPARGAHGWRFRAVREVVRAGRVDDVLPALRRVEAAVAGGLHAAGFVAYEAAPAFDPALATRPPAQGEPLLWFALCAEREAVSPPPAPQAGAPEELSPFTSSLSPAAYSRAIGCIRELIAAGDSYQVNFTFRLAAALHASAEALYRRLCHGQRAAFCACIEHDSGTLLSASPELFFRWQGGELELRPMKGTRPRGRWLAEDDARAAELAASPKDRAENLMIVDLLRNDAGRVAEFGSVTVDELFAVERYPTVLQMTSRIRARTPAGTTLSDLFRALFPCGSVTGAPKVRTSQIIAELEDSPRGVYTGAIGFASPDQAVFSVAIRTLEVDAEGRQARLGVGSGVTWDSSAAGEYQECVDKAAFVRQPPAPALLETLRWEPGAGLLRAELHLARLAASAGYFGVACELQLLEEELQRFASALPADLPLRVRLVLSPDGGVTLSSAAAPAWDEPVRLFPCIRAGDSGDPRWYHKTADRSRYPASSEAAQPLLLNERGELTETPIANLVLELEGALWTPALDAGLLPGVLRGELLEAGRVRERVLGMAEARRATGIWVINALRGWGRAELVAAGEAALAAGATAAMAG